MRITFDPVQRARTLAERGLDFAETAKVFAGHYTADPDLRLNYGEARIISAGLLDGRVVVLVWTPRDASFQ